MDFQTAIVFSSLSDKTGHSQTLYLLPFELVQLLLAGNLGCYGVVKCKDGSVPVVTASWRMSEANLFSNASHLPCNRLKEDDVVIIIFPDLTGHSVIHGLQELPVSNAWEEQCGVLIDVTTPWLIHQLIAHNHVSVSKGLSYKAPEQSKLVQKTIVILVQIANRV